MKESRSRWLRFSVRNRRREIDDEINGHLEERARELIDEGWDPADAGAEARRRFGARDRVGEDLDRIGAGADRERRLWSWFDETRQDLVVGLRRLMKNPGFTAVAILTMALGLGANSAIFGVVNTVILRPLPYPEPERLVRVWESSPARGWDTFAMSQPNYLDYRERNRSLENLAATEWTTFNLTGLDEPMRLTGNWISANFFETIGVPLTLGRSFTPEEDASGDKQHVTILSYELWQSAFGGDEGVIGETISLDFEPYTVVGVSLPADDLPSGPDLYAPLNASRETSRGDHRLGPYGRLLPGISLEQAEADLDTVAAGLEQEYPDDNTGFQAAVVPLHLDVVGDGTRSAMMMLAGAVAFVLLIACANLANLLLARAAGRRREIALYMALGASRARVARQMLVESTLLAVLGGVVGITMAYWGVGAFRALDPGRIPRMGELEFDGAVLGFGLLLSVATGVLSGMVPALQISGRNLHAALGAGGRGSSGDRSSMRARQVLLVAEVALSVILLAGAGLLIRSYRQVQGVEPGFRTENVLTLAISVPAARHPGDNGVAAFYQELLENLEAVPGVESAAAISGLPFGDGNTSMDFLVEGAEPDPDGTTPSGFWRLATPGYFDTLEIPLVGGRVFTDIEDPASGGVVISRRMAERSWPGEDPIGKRFLAWRDPNNLFTVIGVVEDVRERSFEREAVNMVYIPFHWAASMWEYMNVAIATEIEPGALIADVRSAVAAIDPDQPVDSVQPLATLLQDSLAPRRFNTLLLIVFAAVAMVLAAAGVYGVLAYSVARRGREFGVRMAMGARSGQVVSLVLGQGMRLVLIGAAIGVVGAFGLTRLMASLLYGVSPDDPVTLVGATAFLVGISLMACVVPALRATRVDPVTALRSE